MKITGPRKWNYPTKREFDGEIILKFQRHRIPGMLVVFLYFLSKVFTLSDSVVPATRYQVYILLRRRAVLLPVVPKARHPLPLCVLLCVVHTANMSDLCVAARVRNKYVPGTGIFFGPSRDDLEWIPLINQVPYAAAVCIYYTSGRTEMWIPCNLKYE